MNANENEYFIYCLIANKKSDESSIANLRSWLNSQESYLRNEIRKIDCNLSYQDGFDSVVSQIFYSSRKEKMPAWQGPKTLGLILKGALRRLRQEKKRDGKKVSHLEFRSDLFEDELWLDDVCLQSVSDETNLLEFDLERIETYECTVREFAKLLGKRPSVVRALLKLGKLKATKGRIRAFQAFKALGEPTPTIDSILALKALHDLSKAS